jgi:hypothetical protein
VSLAYLQAEFMPHLAVASLAQNQQLCALPTKNNCTDLLNNSDVSPKIIAKINMPLAGPLTL